MRRSEKIKLENVNYAGQVKRVDANMYEVVAIDLAARTVDIKKTKKAAASPLNVKQCPLMLHDGSHPRSEIVCPLALEVIRPLTGAQSR